MTAAAAALPLRRRTWVRVVLWTTGVVVALVAALSLWFAAMLSGGWDDLLSPGGPVATDRDVVAAGEQALDELARVDVPVTALAVAVQQECQAGQHNWKIDDAFDLSCVTTRTTLGPGQAPAFREQALALHEQLARDGWAGEYSPIPAVLTEYWDPLSTSDPSYAPGDLPPATYLRGELRLEVRWLSAGGRFPAPPSLSGPAFTAPGGGAVEPRSLLSPEQHLVSLAVSTESFRD